MDKLKRGLGMVRIKKRGQISIDFILAVMFLMLISIFLYSMEFNFSNSTTDALIVDKLYEIANTFENYALLSYSKNIKISIKLKPIGVKSYTIYFGNKSIIVNKTRTVTFTPTENGVIVEGEVENSGLNLSNNVINITYGNGKFYVLKNVSISIE
jgi:uncharacterized protein (UPF0333 family)